MLAREYEAMRSAKNKLQGSKTGKEYNAATREVDNKRRSISEREGEVGKVNEALLKSRAEADAHDKDVNELRQHLADDERDVATKIAEIEAEIVVASEGRAELRAKLPKDVLRTYDSLVSKRGFSVAPVVKGTCQGCHMALPPQLNNILARLISIETCPRCGRLIYRKELLDPTPEGGESPPA
jgi:predicted  nucleic acid-binding Zn-ribbon protein